MNEKSLSHLSYMCLHLKLGGDVSGIYKKQSELFDLLKYTKFNTIFPLIFTLVYWVVCLCILRFMHLLGELFTQTYNTGSLTWNSFLFFFPDELMF